MTKIGTDIPNMHRKVLRDVRALKDHGFGVFDGAKVLHGVKLVDGVLTRVAHGLGRKLQGYIIVGIRGNVAAGYINDQHDGSHADTGTFMYLTATGYSPTLDMVVF